MEGLSAVFSGRAEAKDAVRDSEVEKLHAKIGQLLVSGIFWRRPSVDEPGPEAETGRSDASGVVGCTSVRADVDQPVGLLLPACGRGAGASTARPAIACHANRRIMCPFAGRRL